MLKTSNVVPYFLIVILLLLIYILWGMYTDSKDTIKQQNANIELIYGVIGDVQAYTNARIDGIEKIKSTRWKLGKHKNSW